MRFVFILCTLGLMAMLTIWQHLQAVSAGYEITKLRRERNILAEENRRLELEADRLKSPDNLLARLGELGLGELRPARPEDTVLIGEGSARISISQPVHESAEEEAASERAVVERSE
jgi:hypothetical protein